MLDKVVTASHITCHQKHTFIDAGPVHHWVHAKHRNGAAARLPIIQVPPTGHLPIITNASCPLKVGSNVPRSRQGLQSDLDEHVKGSQLRECVKNGLPQVAVTAALCHHLQATKPMLGVMPSGAKQALSDSSLDSSVPLSAGQGQQVQVSL